MSYGIDPLDAALYDACHDYTDPKTGEKGIAPLARRMGVNAGTLQNKANPHNDTHFANIHEFRAVMLSTNDFRPLRVLAVECHHACYALVDVGALGDDELLHAVLKWSRESGDVSQAIDQALSDGQIVASEFVAIWNEIEEAMAATLELRGRLLRKVVDPQHLPEAVRGEGGE